MNSVDVAILQLKYSIQEWACFVSPTEHYQRLPTHTGQPDLDIESQCLSIELYNFVRAIRSLDVYLKGF